MCGMTETEYLKAQVAALTAELSRVQADNDRLAYELRFWMSSEQDDQIAALTLELAAAKAFLTAANDEIEELSAQRGEAETVYCVLDQYDRLHNVFGDEASAKECVRSDHFATGVEEWPVVLVQQSSNPSPPEPSSDRGGSDQDHE